MKNIVVYDFDKTLTYKDTLLGFFRHAAPKNIFYPLKLTLYIAAMVGVKIKIISNSKLKDSGIKLFLKGMSEKEFEEKCQSYAKIIICNKVYQKLLQNETSCHIVTASFETYVKALFPDSVKVTGSRILFEDGKAEGLLFNCYGTDKAEALHKAGINAIDIFYTDSFSDFPLVKMAKKSYIVKGDMLIECSSAEVFQNYFQKS